uniref:Uncharacterized protein n=1 Tax=Sipha flava TaxID=143950 RepID=A0A2S2QC77_9HEMI
MNTNQRIVKELQKAIEALEQKEKELLKYHICNTDRLVFMMHERKQKMLSLQSSTNGKKVEMGRQLIREDYSWYNSVNKISIKYNFNTVNDITLEKNWHQVLNVYKMLLKRKKIFVVRYSRCCRGMKY